MSEDCLKMFTGVVLLIFVALLQIVGGDKLIIPFC